MPRIASRRVIARIYTTTPKDVADFVRVDQIRDLRQNVTPFPRAVGFDSADGAGEGVNRRFLEHRIVGQRLDTTRFVESPIVRQLQRQSDAP